MTDQRNAFELAVTFGDASFSARGNTSTVLDAYADFKDLLQVRTGAPRKPAAERDDEPDRSGADKAPMDDVKAPTNLPLKPYLGQFGLPGNKEKATAVLAWSAESGAEVALTIDEVESLMKKGGFKAPANLGRDLRQAESEGWIDSSGPGRSSKFSINGYGEGVLAGWMTTKG
ncbi:MAG: hypothetical protein JST59_30015 [Actinobacteria bacterium]|nr:hypothetical protein [Actinomycetota bacterium]